MADPTPMDVDDEAAPTDLVLPDVMEGMLRMAALTTPDTRGSHSIRFWFVEVDPGK